VPHLRRRKPPSPRLPHDAPTSPGGHYAAALRPSLVASTLPFKSPCPARRPRPPAERHGCSGSGRWSFPLDKPSGRCHSQHGVTKVATHRAVRRNTTSLPQYTQHGGARGVCARVKIELLSSTLYALSALSKQQHLLLCNVYSTLSVYSSILINEFIIKSFVLLSLVDKCP